MTLDEGGDFICIQKRKEIVLVDSQSPFGVHFNKAFKDWVKDYRCAKVKFFNELIMFCALHSKTDQKSQYPINRVVQKNNSILIAKK